MHVETRMKMRVSRSMKKLDRTPSLWATGACAYMGCSNSPNTWNWVPTRTLRQMFESLPVAKCTTRWLEVVVFQTKAWYTVSASSDKLNGDGQLWSPARSERTGMFRGCICQTTHDLHLVGGPTGMCVAPENKPIMPSICASFPIVEWCIERHAKAPPICQRHMNPPICRVSWRHNGSLVPHQPKKQRTWIKWHLEKNVTHSTHCFQKMSEHSKNDSTNSIGSSGEKRNLLGWSKTQSWNTLTREQDRTQPNCKNGQAEHAAHKKKLPGLYKTKSQLLLYKWRRRQICSRNRK